MSFKFATIVSGLIFFLSDFGQFFRIFNFFEGEDGAVSLISKTNHNRHVTLFQW